MRDGRHLPCRDLRSCRRVCAVASAVVVTPSVRGQQPELVAGSSAAVASCRGSSARAASRHACFEMRGVALGSAARWAARTRPERSSSSWPRQSAAKRSLMPGLQISISGGGHSRRNGAPSDPAARSARCDAVGHRDARSRGGSGASRQPLDGRGRGIGCGLSVSGCGARVPRAQRGGRRLAILPVQPMDAGLGKVGRHGHADRGEEPMNADRVMDSVPA